MGEVSLRRRVPLRWLGVLVLLHLLAAGCASDDMARRRAGPVELQVTEDWELLVERPTTGFADTVAQTAEDFAEPAGVGGAAVGCVAGGVALAAVSQGAGAEPGCLVGGIALYPVGYVLGFGAGAVVGGVHGVIDLFFDAEEEIDMRLLLAVFEGAMPRVDLTNSMLAQSQRRSLVTLISGGEAGETESISAEKSRATRRLTLTITRLQLTTTTSARPTSRLRLAVEGKLTDRETGQKIGGGSWSYDSESVSTAELAADGAKALKAELAAGWQTLAEEILSDLLEPDR
jgi:hypothetical protein